MAELPLDQAIPRFKTNEDRIDTFVNGDENATYTTSGGVQVPSVRKVVADINEEGEGWLAQAEEARDAAVAAAEFRAPSMANFLSRSDVTLIGSRWRVDTGEVLDVVAAGAGDYNHPVTGRGVIAVAVDGHLRVSAFPTTADPVARVNTAFQRAKVRGVASVDGRGLGTLACTSALVLVRGINADLTGTTFSWAANANMSAIVFDVSGPRSHAVITGLRGLGPKFAEEGVGALTDGIDFGGGVAEVTQIDGYKFYNCSLEGFRHARKWGSNAYIIKFFACKFGRSYTGLFAPSGLSNQGEAVIDFGGVTYQCQWGAQFNSGLLYEIHGGSYDYNRVGDFDLSSGQESVKFFGGNWEWDNLDVAASMSPRVKTIANTTPNGTERSLSIVAIGTHIPCRNWSSWPAGVPFATGRADIMLSGCHIYGLGGAEGADEPLMTGGGRVHMHEPILSVNMDSSYNTGRPINYDPNMEETTGLDTAGWYATGVSNTSATVSDTVSIEKATDVVYAGTKSLKITPVYGVGTTRRVELFTRCEWGDVVSVRMRAYTSGAGTLYASMHYVEVLGYDSKGLPIVGKISKGTYDFVVSDQFVIGSWAKLVILPVRPQLGAPKWATHHRLRLEMVNWGAASGPIYLDNVHVDVITGMKCET